MKSSKKKFLKEKFGKCMMCGTTKKLTIDHITPKSKGGSGRWKNLQVLCRDCNIRKGSRILEPSYPHPSVAVKNGSGIIWNKVVLSFSNPKTNMSEEENKVAEEVKPEGQEAQTGTSPKPEGQEVKPEETNQGQAAV